MGRPEAAPKWRHAVQMQTISLPTVAGKAEKISHNFQCVYNCGSRSVWGEGGGAKGWLTNATSNMDKSCLGDGPNK